MGSDDTTTPALQHIDVLELKIRQNMQVALLDGRTLAGSVMPVTSANQWFSCFFFVCLFVFPQREHMLLGKTVPNDILLLGNIYLEIIPDSWRLWWLHSALDIWLWLFFLPSHTVMIRSTLLQPLLQTLCQVCRSRSLLTDDSNLWEASGSPAAAI